MDLSTSRDPTARRHCFVVEAREAPDTLVRLLTPFAVQAAALTGVVSSAAGGVLSVRIEVDGLPAERADRLLRQLRGMPVVLGVALGWRSLAIA
jgi:putative lipoic acid-binding regulatory protein